MRIPLKAISVLSIAMLIWGCSPAITEEAATTSGAVQGELADGVAIYRGIPYAAAPVGDLRWRAPQPAPAWTKPLQALDYGPACWQATDAGESLFFSALTEGAGMSGFSRWMLTNAMSLVTPNVSEDCLTLNIVAPANADGLPVMFWIHGGGHQFGSGGTTYESPSLARNGVVLVTINYRLGLYGFLAHPELSAEDPHGSSGNYGMLDQIAALEWVRDNISAFGGDPGNVTIFGESAGAHSVGQLMASPPAKGLFHKAVAQSGTGFYQFQAMQHAHERISGFDAGRRVAALAGVSGKGEVAALRKMSIEELREVALNPEVSGTFHPQIDGYVLPESTAYVFSTGKQAGVPLIVGSNADEGSVLYHMGLAPIDGGPEQQPATVADWDALMQAEFEDHATDVSMQYSVDGNQEVVRAAEQMMGDSWFGRHAFYMAQQHSAAGHPAYLYFYERRPPNEDQTIGASHALELNHLFGGFIPFWPMDDRDTELGGEMQAYWSQFATLGDPNQQDMPSWPTFQDLSPHEMSFGHNVTQNRRVAREARYRAMHAQLQRRIDAAAPATMSAGGD